MIYRNYIMEYIFQFLEKQNHVLVWKGVKKWVLIYWARHSIDEDVSLSDCGLQ